MARLISAGRRGALYVLSGVLGGQRLISDIIEDPYIQELRPQERATAQRLASQTLRDLSTMDAILGQFLTKSPTSHVHHILRLGANELCHGGDSHGVVNDWVNIVKSNHRYRNSSGLINAVLRKIAHLEKDEALSPAQLPAWLRTALVQHYGDVATGEIEQALRSSPPTDLTIKSGDAAAWAARLDGVVTPFGSVRLTQPGQISKLDGYAAGEWWIQDSAATLPAKLIHQPKGARVLDLCAAPGGKTMQLAAQGYRVTAIDKSAQRLKTLRSNLKRVGLQAQILQQDAFEHDGMYDAVLLDAPCSATGTLRRHPELPYVKSMDQFSPLIELQQKLLDHATTLLKPKGQLVFCTCSLLPQEGEEQIEKFLARKPDFKLSQSDYAHLAIEAQWQSAKGGIRLRPDYWASIGGMDGFYAAVLEKL